MVLSVRRANPTAAATTLRSSRTTIRSAALMATSVPDPTARPRSATTSAGPSLTAVSDHGDRPALCLKAADNFHFLCRKRSRHDFCDTDR